MPSVFAAEPSPAVSHDVLSLPQGTGTAPAAIFEVTTVVVHCELCERQDVVDGELCLRTCIDKLPRVAAPS